MDAESERERAQAALAAMSEELQAQREAVAASAAAAEAGVSERDEALATVTAEVTRLKEVGPGRHRSHVIVCRSRGSTCVGSWMPLNSRGEGSTCLSMTWRATYTRLYSEAHAVAREAAERGAASEEEVAALCSRLESVEPGVRCAPRHWLPFN